MAARVVSVNVGLPRLVSWQGGQVSTGIFKTPVGHLLNLRALNLDGDAQADLSVHGGRDKAVYMYPAEHYPRWHAELDRADLAWGPRACGPCCVCRPCPRVGASTSRIGSHQAQVPLSRDR